MTQPPENQAIQYEDVESSLLKWRERILRAVYIAGALFSVPLSIAAAYILLQNGRWEIALVETVYAFTAMVILIFWKRISYILRAVFFLAMVYSLGLMILFRLGPFSGGPVWIFTFAALAGILLGLRAAIMSLAINLITLLGLGWIILAKLMPWTTTYHREFGQLALGGLSFIMLNTLVSVSVAMFTRNLQSAAHKEKLAALVLAKERAELQREIEERKRLHHLLLVQHDLRERLSTCNDLQSVLGQMLDAALQVEEVDSGAVYLQTEDGVLGMIRHAGLNDDLITKIDNLTGKSLTVSKSENRSDPQHTPHHIPADWPDVPQSHGFKARVFIPVIIEETPVAGLLALSKSINELPSSSVTALETIASQIRDATVRIKAEKDLEENRIKFRAAFMSNPGAITINRWSDGRYIDVNPSTTAMYGYTREEFIGHTSFELDIWAGQPEQAHRRAAMLYKDGVVRDFEFTFRRKNGDMGTALNSAEIIDLNDEPHLLSMSIDITERRQMTEALKESEERFRSAFIHAALGMVVTHLSGQFLAVNPYFCEMLGYTEDELLEKTFRDISHPDDVERTSEMHWKLVAGKVNHVWLEKRFLTKDGQVIWGLSSSALVRNSHGQPLHIVAHIQNITERKQYEQELQQSEQRYRQVVENVPTGICLADLPTGRFLFLNQKIIDMFGYPKEQTPNMTFWDVIDPSEHDLVARRLAVRTANPDKHMEPLRYTGVRPDGSTFRFKIDIAYITHEGKQAVQAIIQDVTNVERLERQLAQAQKMEAMGTLTSGIAHDFNNILQSISGYIQLMKRLTGQGTGFAAYLEEMDRITSRAAKLVDRLLTFSRRIEPELKTLDLNNTIRQTVQSIVRTLPDTIKMETALAEDLRLIDADSGLMEQVLFNLCGNARDAMPDGGTLTIATSNVFLDGEQSLAYVNINPGDHVQLTVSDNGQGIEPETLKRLFEPFFTTKVFGKGTGLGLSIVYSIVQTHRGAITCDTEVGKGASFRILFPASVSTTPEVVESISASMEPAGGRETILLVDDEKPILETGAEILTMKGYSVITASSGEEALEKYKAGPTEIDLVILDLGMPGMGGQKCLDELLKLNSGARVLIASGYSSGTKAEEVIRQGAVGFISKPYRLNNLLNTAREVLDRSSA